MAKKDKTLEDLNKKFQSALDHQTWKNWRANAIRDFAFKEGDQWTDKERKDLQDRGQPDTVENQIKVVCDRLMGKYRKTKSRIGYKGRNLPDQPIALALTALSLYIHQHNKSNYEESDAFDDGITGGFGCIETFLEYDRQWKPQIMVRHEDCFNIYPDPHSTKYDWNEDAKFIARAKWVDVSVAKEIYPGFSKELDGLVGYDPAEEDNTSYFRKEDFIDDKTDRVRLVEMQIKKIKKVKKVLAPDGNVTDITGLKGKKLKEAESKGRVVERMAEQIYVAVFCGDVLFENKKAPHNFPKFTFTPYFCFRKKDGEPYSPVRMIIDPQMEINKRRSKALHLLTLNQSIYEEGAVSDPDDLATEMARPDGQIKLLRGGMERFRIEKNNDLASTQMGLHAESKQAIRDITGVNPESGGGGRSEIRSGVGVARKQEVTDEITFPIFDNLKRTRELRAELELAFIQQYFTDEMVFSVTDDLQQTQMFTINEPGQDIKTRTFDIVVDDLPDTTTIQQEQLNIVSQALPQFLQYGPAGGKLLIEMSDLKNKKELLEIVAAMGQPTPPEAKVSLTLDWDELDGTERAAFAGKLGMQELAQYEMQSGAQGKTDKKLMADMGKTQSKENMHSAELDHTKDKDTADIVIKGITSVKDSQNTAQQN